MSQSNGKKLEEVKICSAKKKISDNLIDLKNILISGSKELLDKMTPKKNDKSKA